MNRVNVRQVLDSVSPVRLVYDLYGLIEEGIKIVEEALRAARKLTEVRALVDPEVAKILLHGS